MIIITLLILMNSARLQDEVKKGWESYESLHNVSTTSQPSNQVSSQTENQDPTCSTRSAHTHTQCALAKPRFHKRLPVKSRLKGQILKTEGERERGFWKRRKNESEELLQLAPVVEEEDHGGGLESTKAQQCAAVTKPSQVCLLWRCCPVALAATYCRDAHGLCFRTQTGGVESELCTPMRDWTPTALEAPVMLRRARASWNLKWSVCGFWNTEITMLKAPGSWSHLWGDELWWLTSDIYDISSYFVAKCTCKGFVFPWYVHWMTAFCCMLTTE